MSTELEAPRHVRILKLLGLTTGHALSDAYINFVAPLWPQIKRIFDLTNSDVGVITFWWGLAFNFAQPIFGYIADRWQPRRLLVLAVLISTLMFSFMGYARSLPMFIVCIMIGGLGVSMFHPRAGSMAMQISGNRRALGMGIFSAGGAIGYALGYLISPYLFNRVGDMTGLAVAAPVGIIAATALLFVEPKTVATTHATRTRFRRDVLPYIPRIFPLMAVMSLRSASVVAFASFIPILLDNQGHSLIAGGKAGFWFVAGGAVGGIIGGQISDRLGRKGITIVTLLCSPPLLWACLKVVTFPSLMWFYLMLFITGIVLRSSEPVNVTHTQELLPKGASLAASLGMGGAWGFAGLIAPVVGYLADKYSVQFALSLTIWLPFIAAGLAFLIPDTKTHQKLPETTD